MVRNLLLKSLNKYASKWLVLFIDVLLVSFSFLIAYFIRFDISMDFNFNSLYLQLPIVIVISLFSFLLVGSYKGIIRHTGIKDVLNVTL